MSDLHVTQVTDTTPHPLSTTNYNAHKVQLRFHAEPAPWRWFCAGYGVGKTTVGVIEAFLNATIHHPGYTGIVAAPTFPLLMQAWFSEWRQWIPQDWWTLHQDSKKGSEIKLRTPDGKTSNILLRSTSVPWSNEGVNAAWLVFDEAPRERNNTSVNILRGRLRRGYPGRQRTAILTGPPQGRAHWTATMFGTNPDTEFGRIGHSKHWTDGMHAVVRAETSDNPYLPPDYEAGMRRSPGATKAWCDQYLRAMFVATEGQVWSMFSRDTHVVPAASLEGREWRRVHSGQDWGWTHPGVNLVGLEDGFGNIYVVHEEVHSQKTVTDTPDGWVSLIRTVADKYKVERVFCDPSAPGSIEAVARGLRRCKGRTPIVYPADNDVGEGIRRVAAMFEWAVERKNRTKAIVTPREYRPGYSTQVIGEMQRPGLYISDACPRTIACLEGYTRKKDRDGELTEQPVKKDDDPADALRYLVMGATNP